MPARYRYLLSTRPPSESQRRAVRSTLLLLLLGLAAVAPFAERPLEHWAPFLPAYAMAVLALDLIAAVLLLAQFATLRDAALLPLAAAFLFAGLTAATWALTFPGAFAEAGLLGGDLQTTAVIAAFRRLAFPLGVLLYAVLRLRRLRRTAAPSAAPVRPLVVWTVLATLGAAAAVTAVAVEGPALTPAFMSSTRTAAATWDVVLWLSILATLAAAACLWRLPCTTLDLWLLVTLAAFMIEILLLGFLSGGQRLSLGWWAGRAFGLASAGVVAMALLAETASLNARLVKSLLAQNQAREERAATLEALAAAIAHELNQPLAAIATGADAARRWLQRPVPDSAQVQRRLEAIAADARRAAEVLAGLRRTFGRRGTARQAVEPVALLRSAAELAAEEARAARVRIELRAAARLPAVEGDAEQLRQVLLNLVTNAVEALQAVEPARRRVLLSADVRGHEVVLAVEDSGPGLEHAMLERSFEGLHSTKPQGMGMGLLICRTIVEAHGGRLVAATPAGGGARIEAILPARRPPGGGHHD